jgi:hypothetical protein
VPIATGEALIALAERASTDGVRVAMGGQVIADAQTGEISSEAIGLLIAALVLVLTFGSVVAAGLPWRRPCSASGSRPPSGASSPPWSTCPTGDRPSPR